MTPTTYPGQCVHAWAPDPSRPPGCEKCLVPGCHAIATRGRDGLIDTYDSGIRETPYAFRPGDGHAAHDEARESHEAAA